MKYNAECTVWHKELDGYTINHYPCWWQDTEAVNINKSAKTDIDTVLVHLPIDAVVSKLDYIIKGNVDFEVKESVTDLLKIYNPLKVSTVSRKDYGSDIMHHTEVTAR